MPDAPRSCCAPARDGPSVSPSAIVRHSDPIKRRWSAPLGGRFRMGTDTPGFLSDGEGPARAVTVSPFQIACHAVSNLQFADFVRATNYTTDAERAGWSYVFAAFVPDELAARINSRAEGTPWWLPVPRAYWAQPEGPHSSVLDRLDHPAVHISWNDAYAYGLWSGTRLPTEAEWEHAARGGLEGALYPWGNELTAYGKHRCNIWQGAFPDRNTAEDGYAGTAPVYAFAPNAYGVYNMAGNVWEWCSDFFSPHYHAATSNIDPIFSDDTGRRSLRGGSYLCHESYCNRYRVAARSANTPESSAGNIGFRVAKIEVGVASQI